MAVQTRWPRPQWPVIFHKSDEKVLKYSGCRSADCCGFVFMSWRKMRGTFWTLADRNSQLHRCMHAAVVESCLFVYMLTSQRRHVTSIFASSCLRWTRVSRSRNTAHRVPPTSSVTSSTYLLVFTADLVLCLCLCVMFPCPVCWCFVARDVKLRFCMCLLIRFLSWFTFGCCMCDFLTSVLFFSFGR